MRWRRVAWLALLLAGCATPDRDITPALMGTWGGPHIGLTVGELDSDVQFDCADGTIIGPYVVHPDGRFEWPGKFARGTGGPVREGQETPEVDATYVGVVKGPEMTLTVKLDDGTVIGPFKLERFKEGQLTRCL
jgi:hypothetical protein